MDNPTVALYKWDRANISKHRTTGAEQRQLSRGLERIAQDVLSGRSV